MNDQTKGLIITTLGALFVVPDALFIRLIDATPLVISFWRGTLVGLAVLTGMLALKGSEPFRAVARTGRYGAIYMFCTGASGILFVLAVSLTSVANVVFIIASMPIFAAVYSRVFLHEPIRPRMVITIAAVVAGLAIIAYGSGRSVHSNFLGDALALCVAACFAAGLTAARRARAVSMVPALPVAYLVSSLLMLPFIDPLSVKNAQWFLVGMHGAIIALSAVLLATGPRYITSAEVALLILLESVLAPLLVWAVLGEYPGRWALIGGAVVIGALTVSNLVVLMRRRPVSKIDVHSG